MLYFKNKAKLIIVQWFVCVVYNLFILCSSLLQLGLVSQKLKVT